jgi:hypothetical protein
METPKLFSVAAMRSEEPVACEGTHVEGAFFCSNGRALGVRSLERRLARPEPKYRCKTSVNSSIANIAFAVVRTPRARWKPALPGGAFCFDVMMVRVRQWRLVGGGAVNRLIRLF